MRFLKLAACVASVAAVVVAGRAQAAGTDIPLLAAKVELSDRASLQRGAKLFINYCAGCHSAQFMRYSQLGRDLGLTEDQVRANLMFATDKPGDPIHATVSDADASAWFGQRPPDLSLTARARGPDWIYTYLMTFYRDESRPFGANNLVFPDVAMPHVLVDLQGVQVRRETGGEDGHGSGATGAMELLDLTEPGSMNVAEYRRTVRDLVNFLVYLGEPAKLHRYAIGGWVLLFLIVFFFISRLLYKEYWKDVH